MTLKKALITTLATLALAGTAPAYTVPNATDLLFGINTDNFPASGNTGNWTAVAPASGVFNTIGTPTVEVRNTVKWEKNVANGNGYYNSWAFTRPVAVNGVTAIAAVKPFRANNDRNWTPIIDVLFGAFRLGVRNDTGVVILTRSNPSGTQTQVDSTAAIPNGQSVVISAVVQTDGSYVVYTNGVSIMSGGALSGGVTSLKDDNNARPLVCIGTSKDDTSATLNGNIGDVYMWKSVLSTADRQQMENDLMAKFHIDPANNTPKTITATTSGGATITPSGVQTVQYEADKAFTVTVPFGYGVDLVLDAGTANETHLGNVYSYTFTSVTANRSILAAASALPTRTIQGNVSAKAGGGATVSVRATPGALPSMQVTTDSLGHYSMTVPTAVYYICASQTGYMISGETSTASSGDQTINFTLTAKRNIPKMENLLLAADTSDMGAVGTAGDWPLLYSTYTGVTKMTALTSPTVTKVRGIKYDFNQRGTGGDDGYRLNSTGAGASIPVNGATVVAVVKPTRNSTADGWNSVVDIFRDNLILGVKNDTGLVQVRRNGTDYWSATALPNDQLTILSLVVQSTGAFKVWASAWNTTLNQFGTATLILDKSDVSAFPAFVPGQFGSDDWRKYINFGRNNGDGWSTYNGYIGDVFVYKSALSDTDRATLEADINTKTTNITTYNITAMAGTGGSISPAGVTAVGETDNQTYTITPNFGYNIDQVLVDGVNNAGAVSSGTYTFSNVTATHTISASFIAKTVYAVSGTVMRASDSTPISGAKVYVRNAANASINPIYTLTTDVSGNYSASLFNGTWYICASATGFTTSPDISVAVSGAPLTGKDFPLVASGKNIPSMDTLLFSLYGTALTVNGGTTAPWPMEHPKGLTASVMGTPQMTTVGSLQWEQNRYASGDGYLVGNYTTAIPVNGITALAVIQPQGDGSNGGDWTSIIDVMYSRFILGIRGTTGELIINRNGTRNNTGIIIPNGQKTILTAIVQPDGQYQVFTNGVRAVNVTSTSAMISLDPNWNGGLGFWSNINVGRNNPDGWTTYKGNIGAAFLWKTALGAQDRMAFESELGTTFAIPLYHTISASAGANGTISPSGSVGVADGANQTFTFTPSANYSVDVVTVDGTAQPGHPTSYTFSNVTADHTIAATFHLVQTITATVSGGNGTITPSGAVLVANGDSQTFAFTPDPGYIVNIVAVDSTAQPGHPGSYTFSNVTAAHTISVSFVAGYTITASAGAGGTITPSGITYVTPGATPTFTATPSFGYKVADVLVDSVSQGASGTYVFPPVNANHTITATFSALAQYAVSGQVTDAASGNPVAGATVYFSTTPNAFTNAYATATTDGAGNYSRQVYEGLTYISADGANYYMSADVVTNLTTTTTGVNLVLVSSTRHTPGTDQLLFAARTDGMPVSGPTGNWQTDVPVGGNLAQMGNPQVAIVNGKKWNNNVYGSNHGYQLGGQVSSAIPCSGATAVVAVKPKRNGIGNDWNSVVDVFYNRFVLGVRNDTGLVYVSVNGNRATSSVAIPDGQITVLSLVVQADGSYKVWANGAPVLTGTVAGGFTSLNPTWNGGTTGYWSYINVGRNNPDGWTVFNGNIGDVFVYTNALSASDRRTLEADLANKFGAVLLQETSVTAVNANAAYSSAAQSVSLSASVNNVVSGSPVTVGSVTFTIKDGGNTIGTPVPGTVDGTGTATATYTLPANQAIKTYTIVANYSNGGVTLADSTDTSHTLTVVKGASTVTVTGATVYSAGSPQGPDTVTKTGSTGAVTYSYSGVDPTFYGPSATKPSAVGTYQVVATLAGDANYNGAQSPAFPFRLEQPPVPGTMTVETLKGVPASVPLAKLVSVATGETGENLEITAVVSPTAHGTAAIAGGNLVYTPAANYVGPDVVNYTLIDNDGGVATGTLNITVLSDLTGPANAVEYALIDGNTKFRIVFAGILQARYKVEKYDGATWATLEAYSNVAVGTNGQFEVIDPVGTANIALYRTVYLGQQ